MYCEVTTQSNGIVTGELVVERCPEPAMMYSSITLPESTMKIKLHPDEPLWSYLHFCQLLAISPYL